LLFDLLCFNFFIICMVYHPTDLIKRDNQEIKGGKRYAHSEGGNIISKNLFFVLAIVSLCICIYPTICKSIMEEAIGKLTEPNDMHMRNKVIRA